MAPLSQVRSPTESLPEKLFCPSTGRKWGFFLTSDAGATALCLRLCAAVLTLALQGPSRGLGDTARPWEWGLLPPGALAGRLPVATGELPALQGDVEIGTKMSCVQQVSALSRPIY